jgi:hypothetical protein
MIERAKKTSYATVPLKGHGNEQVFSIFCINWFGIGPLHNLSGCSDFDFKFAEIFVIKN